MKKTKLFIFGFVAALFGSLVIQAHPVSADFQANRIIDDPIFDNSGALDAGAINTFLNTFPNSCISPNSGFEARIPSGYSPSGGFTFGDFVSAGQVIATAAQVYGINPEVLLVTLQKEQSLVSGATNFCNNGDENKYAAAMGYGCPDSGTVYDWSGVSLYRRNGVEHTDTGSTCVNSAVKAGFSQQTIRAAWLLKFGEQRSKGNMNWAVVTGSWDNSDDPQSCYSGPMTQGNWQVCPSGPTVFYDGYHTIDGTAVHMDTGGTAALYWYTPHFSGNQHFSSIFETWFGPTRGDYCLTSQAGVQTGVFFNAYDSKIDKADFVINSGSGSSCVESHVWNPGMQSWQAHIVSNQPSVNGADVQFAYGNLDGSGQDNPVMFGVRNTASGKVEANVWTRDMRTFIVHAVSNLPSIDPADCKIIFADLDGIGKDLPIVACYRNTSTGMVELHQWNDGLQSWAWHRVTNLPAIDPAKNTIVAGDTNGDGKDELIVVSLQSTGSGMVEFHIWDPGQSSWQSHIASNQPEIDPTASSVQFANVDGKGADEAVLVGFKNTGSGKIEFHTWNPGFSTWQSHIASNQQTIQ